MVESRTSDRVIKRRLAELAEAYRKLDAEAQALCQGRTVRIVSDFNGQEFGRSKPSLRGKTLELCSASLYSTGEFSFCTFDLRVNAGFGPADVEFI